MYNTANDDNTVLWDSFSQSHLSGWDTSPDNSIKHFLNDDNAPSGRKYKWVHLAIKLKRFSFVKKGLMT